MRKKSKQVYVTHKPLTAHQVLEKAADILAGNSAGKGVSTALKLPSNS